jgi:AAA+ ATPase superfamily predicted ATPase
MEKIIGGIEEQKVLEAAYKSKKLEFIAVYGRRRIGSIKKQSREW